MLNQGSAEKRHGRKKERNANQVVMWIHANHFRQSSESRFGRKETREKKGVMQTGRIYTETEL
jgi:hypothetical protein